MANRNKLKQRTCFGGSIYFKYAHSFFAELFSHFSFLYTPKTANFELILRFPVNKIPTKCFEDVVSSQQSIVPTAATSNYLVHRRFGKRQTRVRCGTCHAQKSSTAAPGGSQIRFVSCPARRGGISEAHMRLHMRICTYRCACAPGRREARRARLPC